MPNLTIELRYKTELSSRELRIILKGLDGLTSDQEAKELAEKLRDQRKQFLRSMRKQVGIEEDNPEGAAAVSEGETFE